MGTPVYMIWEMFAKTPDGERVYCGISQTERGADLLLKALQEKGFTDTQKRQIPHGQHGCPATIRRYNEMK